MRSLVAARTAVLAAVAAIDAETRDTGLGGLPPADDDPRRRPADRAPFVAAIDDPSRIRRSRDIGAHLGLVPRRYQSGELDYVGGISKKCGDRRVRTLLYEATNVMLTRYKGQLKLNWAFAIARRSAMRKARVALARRLAIILHAMLRDRTEFASAWRRQNPRTGGRIELPQGATSREGADDGADCVACGHQRPTAISTKPPCTQLTPSSAGERAENTGIARRRHQEEPPRSGLRCA
jgi:hypothetical protein